MIFKNAQVEIAELPKSNSIQFEALLLKYKKLQFIQAIILFIIISVVIFVFDLINDFPSFLRYTAWGFWAIWTILRLILIHVGFKFKGYAIRELDVHYKSGFINRKTITVPVNRIQHMEIRQGIFSRILGLSKLKLFTAGDSSSDLSLRGISPETAQQLKEMLTAKINHDEQN